MDEAERDRLVTWLAAEFEVQNGIDVRNDEGVIERLREAAERAVEDPANTREINMPFLASDETGPKHFHVVLAKKRIDDIRAGREGPPHVDRAPRTIEDKIRSLEPPESKREPPRRSSPTLIIAIVVLVLAGILAFVFTSSHSHDEHDGHGQEHKR